MSFLGRIAYHAWFRPRSELRDLWLDGGPRERRRTRRGREDMEQAMASLAVPSNGAGPPLELHLVTGRRFCHQTAFCLLSFARQCGRAIAPRLYDDGTLGGEEREVLGRLFPHTTVVTAAETLERLEQYLPVDRFPALRERWSNYPNLRKLIDPHLGRSGWKLVLDSDLLFFRRPEFLLDWLSAPDRPLHAVDCETSYGYSRPLLSSLAGGPLADLVNVGLTGLDSAAIDWERLEHWVQTLHAREGTNYYLEQALVAMVVAGHECAVAPENDYVTRPSPAEAVRCRAVMHHYVAHSKRWYYQHNWRRFAGPTYRP